MRTGKQIWRISTWILKKIPLPHDYYLIPFLQLLLSFRLIICIYDLIFYNTLYRKVSSFQAMDFQNLHFQMDGKAKLDSTQLDSQEEVFLVHHWMPSKFRRTLGKSGKRKQIRKAILLVSHAIRNASQKFYEGWLVSQFCVWHVDWDMDQFGQRLENNVRKRRKEPQKKKKTYIRKNLNQPSSSKVPNPALGSFV